MKNRIDWAIDELEKAKAARISADFIENELKRGVFTTEEEKSARVMISHLSIVEYDCIDTAAAICSIDPHRDIAKDESCSDAESEKLPF